MSAEDSMYLKASELIDNVKARDRTTNRESKICSMGGGDEGVGDKKKEQ